MLIVNEDIDITSTTIAWNKIPIADLLPFMNLKKNYGHISPVTDIALSQFIVELEKLLFVANSPKTAPKVLFHPFSIAFTTTPHSS